MARTAPRKLYRTMQGRMVDIEKLRAANEDIRAVGNMNVNARGDVLGPGNTVLKTKEQVMREYYEAPKGAVADTPIKKVVQPTPIPQKNVVETKVINPTKTATTPTRGGVSTTPTPQVEGIKKAKKINIFKPKEVEVKKPETKSGIDAALEGLEE